MCIGFSPRINSCNVHLIPELSDFGMSIATSVPPSPQSRENGVEIQGCRILPLCDTSFAMLDFRLCWSHYSHKSGSLSSVCAVRVARLKDRSKRMGEMSKRKCLPLLRRAGPCRVCLEVDTGYNANHSRHVRITNYQVTSLLILWQRLTLRDTTLVLLQGCIKYNLFEKVVSWAV
jgi:hypothetical protein